MDYLRACVFDWRKKKAIRQAKRDANLYGKNTWCSYITGALYVYLCKPLKR